MSSIKMNAIEKRASWSLAAIMSLRMLGLFMVLPIFSLYAHQLQGATPFLLGVALGIYGLTQGLFQIPFGMLSDHIGRRKVITTGLIIFAIGSIIAALSHTMFSMILGRALQGMGAIGSTLMAMVADFTRPEQRTKAMAINGMTIGMSFTLAIMLGPLFANWLTVPGLFWLTTAMSLVGIFLLYIAVPTPAHCIFHQETELDVKLFSSVLFDPVLSTLYLSIFFLHIIFTATFVVVPISFDKLAGLPGSKQWLLYLPLMLIAFALCIPMIIHAEKKNKLKFYFLIGVILLGIAEIFWWIAAKNVYISSLSLLLFLTAFTLLEAFLPSLISKAAPPSRKGTALGIFSSSQFLGIFVGGTTGGWLYEQWGLQVVYLFCVIIVLFWVTMATKMKTGGIHYGKRR